MPVFDPDILAADAAGRWTAQPRSSLTGFSIDTRTLRPGDVFVALATEKRDGHDFIPEADEAGAAAAIVSREDGDVKLPRLVVSDTGEAFRALARAHRRRFPHPIVGVTGSAGKTSTKDLLSLLLGKPGEVLATEGNLNNLLGVPLTLLRLDPAVHRFAVIEAGISEPGEMRALASMIEPEAAIITTIGPAHLDRLRTVAEVATEKAVLAASVREGGFAVFPDTCLSFQPVSGLSGRSFVAVSSSGSANAPRTGRPVRYTVRHEEAGTFVTMVVAGREHRFRMHRASTGMAVNAVLAAVVALELGISPRDVEARMPAWRPARMRGQILSIEGRFVYLDCYNANPVSMDDSLDGFLSSAPTDQPRLFVVGSMEELGEHAADFHRAVGRRWPLRTGDTLIAFGTHAEALAEGVKEGSPDAEVMVNPDRGEASRLLRGFPGAVFIKGSRRYELEKLVDANRADWREEGEVAA